MVHPFALALAVGSYTLFLFLFIHATLSYLHLHHVQGAPETATWIDLSIDPLPHVAVGLDDFDFDDFAFTTATSARRVWDPGIGIGIDPTDNDTTASELRLTVVVGVVVVVVVEVLTQSVHPTVDHDFLPLNMTMAIVFPLLLLVNVNTAVCVIDPDFVMTMVANPMASLYPLASRYPCCRATWIARILKSLTCLFHYSHPVLSRPTVPNI